jgi:hypothetical protein
LKRSIFYQINAESIINQTVPINKCIKPRNAPILRKRKNDIGEPSRLERLMARILAGLPIGSI